MAASRLTTKQNKIAKRPKEQRSVEEEVFLQQMDGNSITAKMNRQEWKRKEQCAIASEYEVDAYPAPWLAFIALGKPAYSKLMSQFNTGFHSSSNKSPSTLAGSLGKKQRRNMKEVSSESPALSDITLGEDKNKVVTHVLQKASTDRDLLQQCIANTKERIERAERRGKSIDALEDELDALLEKQFNALHKAMEANENPSKTARSSPTPNIDTLLFTT